MKTDREWFRVRTSIKPFKAYFTLSSTVCFCVVPFIRKEEESGREWFWPLRSRREKLIRCWSHHTMWRTSYQSSATFILLFSHCVFSNVSSNYLHTRGCFTFLHCVSFHLQGEANQVLITSHNDTRAPIQAWGTAGGSWWWWGERGTGYEGEILMLSYEHKSLYILVTHIKPALEE